MPEVQQIYDSNFLLQLRLMVEDPKVNPDFRLLSTMSNRYRDCPGGPQACGYGQEHDSDSQKIRRVFNPDIGTPRYDRGSGKVGAVSNTS